MKFTSEQRNLIKETRSKIKKLQEDQSDIYSDLLEKLNMNEQAEEWMFDYIFNDYGTIKNIEDKNSGKS
ncbi:MAG: hypothetical protein ACOVRK_04005 [Chryseobacterium taeanense]|jgi:hypothetical protein